ncbi:glutathione S-transferase [Coniella lustricola]|uniref:Glutathione S-transferase n=1 Tax=Coniella lustricola TaxID=2025994 RepID=A0A2T3A5Y2_9PEZI|nr:glutathione S-transferase [Coniella lustricola]
MPNPVDKTLEPQPSGRAAEFAAAHAAEHPLKLYGGWFCPFVQRAWITLHEKRIAHQYIEINPYHKEASFLALNPRGLVPTLAVPVAGPGANGNAPHRREQKPLYESTVLCEYLDEAYADEGHYGPRLLPAEDAYERARCRLWIDHIGTKIVPGFYQVIQHTPDKAYSLEEARRKLLSSIATWVQEMDGDEPSGPWFLGDRFSLVDVMLAPWARRLFLIDHYKPGGVGIAEARREDEKTWARWQRWFDAMMARDSLRNTTSTDDKYIEVYKRYAEDTTGSEVGQATRDGKRLP